MTALIDFFSANISNTCLLQDEVFHIPQAQAYCEGKFGIWDDKITTPPGLYVFCSLTH